MSFFFNHRIRRPPDLSFIKIPVNKIVGELSKIIRCGRVQSAGILGRRPSILTATRRGERGLQNLDVELGALRKRKFASIDIILALDHLHAGGT